MNEMCVRSTIGMALTDETEVLGQYPSQWYSVHHR